jgi:hypothetical protein
MDITTIIKAFLISLVSSVLAYLNPVGNMLICIISMFSANFIIGLLAGLIANDESFDHKKAFRAISEAVTYILLVAGTFTVSEKMGSKDGAISALSLITWAWIYLYLVNIVKNLKILLPSSDGIGFLYYVISMEFVKKIPLLRAYLNSKKNEIK